MSNFTALTIVVPTDCLDDIQHALHRNSDVLYAVSTDSLPDDFDVSEWDDDSGELYPDDIPEDFPVRPIGESAPMTHDVATCGTCGLSWDDSIVTSMTPAPSGRCPFESFH